MFKRINDNKIPLEESDEDIDDDDLDDYDNEYPEDDPDVQDINWF